MANMIKGKTPEEIRKLFNIVNDFTPEEEVSGHSVFPLLMSNVSLSSIRPRSRRRTYVHLASLCFHRC